MPLWRKAAPGCMYPTSVASDALIAATALVHGMAVVTRNVSDFEPPGSSHRQCLGAVAMVAYGLMHKGN